MIGSVISNSRVILNLFKSDKDIKEMKSVDSEPKKEGPALDNPQVVNLETYAMQGQMQVTFQYLMNKIRETRKQNEIDDALLEERTKDYIKESYGYTERFDGYSDVYDELQELALQDCDDSLDENPDLKALQEFGFSQEIYTLSSKKDELFEKLHYNIPYKPYVIKGESMIIGQGAQTINENKDKDLGVL